VVIGGGLAGIAAALDCADAGAEVTLLEVRRRLGGAIYSFERDGLQIDNGQHVFMRCCMGYRALLERLGSEPKVSVQSRLSVPVLSPGGRAALLARNALPVPLHMAGALARYRYLTVRQRLGAARAALALSRLDADDQGLDEIGFGDWLAHRGQDSEAVGALWDVIVRPTLNLPAAQASLALGAFVFRTALLSRADAGDIGFHVAPLSEVIGEPAERALRQAGIDVRLGWRVERLERTATGLEVHGRGGRAQEDEEESAEPRAVGSERGGGEGFSADVAIVALPHNRAGGLIGPLLGETADRLAALGDSPIVNLHVVYDRQVCEQRFAAGVRTPVQYLFDRTAAGGVPSPCQYLAVSLSAAEREMTMSVDALRELYLPALEELLPLARGAKVERFLVTREHAATFRAAPGVGALRAGPRTSVPGLVLAGTWTDTGWPATLEGAVLSGHKAALQALRTLEAPAGQATGAPSPRAATTARVDAL
jgi:squalene-associated FAD-dependent desaturase